MTNMRWFPRLSVLLLIALSTVARANDDGFCIQQWACVEIVRQPQRTEFWLTNATAYPYTGTLEVELREDSQGTYQQQYTRTRVVDGGQRLKVLELSDGVSFDYDFNWTPGDMHAVHDDDYVYLLPYPADQYYRIVQGFGGGYSHRGASRYALDFAMPVGTPVHASRGGVVIDLKASNTKGGPSRRYARYANFVTILHSDGTTGEYYHLRFGGVAVKVGDRVKPGQLIGYSGNTGFSSLPHLHFAVYRAKSHGNFESLPFKLEQR